MDRPLAYGLRAQLAIDVIGALNTLHRIDGTEFTFELPVRMIILYRVNFPSS